MAKYFEVVNQNDESIVIDDRFICLELQEIFPLSGFNRVPGDSYRNPHYTQKHNLGAPVFWGIGLDGLGGKSICPQITGIDDAVRVEFYDPKSKEVYLNKILRDDIAQVAKIYAFSIRGRDPSAHLTGLEIYNEQWKVVYSSQYGHLNVLACDCVDATVAFGRGGVAFILGEDTAYDYHESAHSGMFGAEYVIYPQFTIKDNTVKIQKIVKQTVYVDDIDEILRDPFHEHRYAAGAAYGWLVGEVI